jgi:hypothetical protein
MHINFCSLIFSNSVHSGIEEHTSKLPRRFLIHLAAKFVAPIPRSVVYPHLCFLFTAHITRNDGFSNQPAYENSRCAHDAKLLTFP